MIPAEFEYVAPTSIDEAVSALRQAVSDGTDVKVLGGGQSLMPVLRLRMAAPELLVDLDRVGELRGVRDDGDAIVIGAMTTHHVVSKDPLVHEHATVLALAAETVADLQVRHRGTLGGALVHADPAGDLPAPVLALGAELVIAGADGARRTVAAADFFEDLFTTAVGEDELLVEIRIPKHTGWGGHYEKFNRISHAWSIVGVAAAVRVEGGTHRRGTGGAHQHGVGAGARPRRRGGARRQGRDGRRGQGRVRRGGRGHEPALGRQRRRRLPPPPRRCAHRSRRAGRRGSLGRMELHHEFVVPIGIDAAWEAFNDLERIGPAFPGAAVTGVDGDGFTGTAKVKLGPISLQYNGTGRFAERDEEARTAVIEAQGKDRRGNGTAGATIMASLTAEGEGSTRVLLDTDLKITGRPAQFGRGVIQDVGSKILDQFAANLTTLLAAPEGAAGEVDEAPVVEPAAEPETAEAEPAAAGRAGDAEAEPAPAVQAEVPAPAVAPAPAARSAPARAVAEPAELDLGGVVGPALLQRYGVTALAVVVTAVLTWLVARRRS